MFVKPCLDPSDTSPIKPHAFRVDDGGLHRDRFRSKLIPTHGERVAQRASSIENPAPGKVLDQIMWCMNLSDKGTNYNQ